MYTHQRGDIALYVALIMIIVMTSAAVVFSSLLSKQIPFTRSVVQAEQAFYAANSGLEEALFYLARNNESTTADTPRTGSIEYGEEITIEYKSYATLSQETGTTCANSEATVNDLVRRVIMGGLTCD